MAENNSNGGNGAIYFFVGALVALVAAFGVYCFGGLEGTPSDDADFSISVNEDGIEVRE